MAITNEISDAICPACGGTKSPQLLPLGQPPLPGEHDYQWFACVDCRSHFASPRKEMDYDSAYQSASTYSDSMASFAEQVRETETAANGACFNRAISAAILRRIPSGRHLDLGMGSGFLLEISRRAGHSIFGVDVSQASRTFVEKAIPNVTVAPDLAQLAGTFSTITALEVLEHLAQPLAFLTELRSRLDDDGLLLMSVPNVERGYWRSGEQGGERRHWIKGGVGDTSPHHLTRFSADGLRNLMGRAGFEDVYVAHTPLDVVTWLIWDLDMPVAISMTAGLRRRLIPFSWFQRFLMERVVLPFWRRDQSTGYGIMVVARKRMSPDRPLLSQLLESTRENIIQRHLEAIDTNVAIEAPKYAMEIAVDKVLKLLGVRRP